MPAHKRLPPLQATFAVTLDGVPPGYIALGNMPVASSTTNGDGSDRVTYQVTPRMSTYLVAAVISPMVSVTSPNGGMYQNITVSVYAPAIAANEAKMQYALDTGVAALAYYESTFGVPYPLPKADMVAVSDFAAGGEYQGRTGSTCRCAWWWRMMRAATCTLGRNHVSHYCAACQSRIALLRCLQSRYCI